MDLKQEILNRVKDNPNVLKELSEEHRNDFEICATALLYSDSSSFHCIKHVGFVLRNDPEFMLLAVDKSPYHLFHAGPDVLENTRVVRRACSRAKTDLMFFFCLVAMGKFKANSVISFAKKTYAKKYYKIIKGTYVDSSTKNHVKKILALPPGTYTRKQIAQASGLTIENAKLFLKSSSYFIEKEIVDKKNVAAKKNFVYEKIL